ncbi:MAG: hypothetical protein RLZZ413_2013 [Pseudomonadota bacterium]
MKSVAGVMVMALALAACSPDKLATDLTRRTAKTVVLPVVRNVAPPPADTLATECILSNASNAELNELARNVGNEAGTLTIQNIRTIAERPSTRACIAGKGLAPLAL